jgi:protein involved in polysaccharide export with SLBB domain
MAMRRSFIRRRFAVAAGLVLMAGLPFVRGQNPLDPVQPPRAAVAPKPTDQPAWAKETEDSIKPLPLEAIPDNPPPHEGAMCEISYRIETPDLILVEVLEAFPGRPITGETLVLSDGTVSLQWYGSVHVAGLTPAQAKVKIIHHLRPYFTDQALGLIVFDEGGRSGRGKGPFPADPFPKLPPQGEVEPPADEGGMPPLPRSALVPPPEIGGVAVGGAKAEGALPAEKATAKGAQPAKHSYFPEASKASPLRAPTPRLAIEAHGPPKPEAADPMPTAGNYVYVHPAESTRVFVVVSAFNTKVYYVQGDVGSPGRHPWTGNETVMDALTFSGGFLPEADRHNIRLNRPARGDKPARSYKLDYDAIERGEKKANLQMFPGDRLIVERKDNFERRA